MGSIPDEQDAAVVAEGEPTRDFRAVGSSAARPAGAPSNIVRKDNITFDQANPNIARAVRTPRPMSSDNRLTYDEYVTRMRKMNQPDVIEGSDSERTGTTWGLPGVDDWPTVQTPQGEMPEGFGPGRAQPNRNTGQRGASDPTYMVGSWSTIDDQDGKMGAGSPSGNA